MRRIAPVGLISASYGDGVPSPSRSELVALAGVTLLGLLVLTFPFSSNQATFSLFAEQALGGDVLYRDVIDLKQPGIFVFFGLAQLPFGRSPVGVHLVELLVWLGFVRWMQLELRTWFRTGWIAATAPLAVVGTYYVTATTRDLTQADVLVSIPLLVAVVLGTTADATQTRRWAGAGVATTLVALLKLPYAVIPVVLWLPHVVGLLRTDATTFLRRTVPSTSVAVAMTLLPFAVYAVATGVAGDLWAFWFEWATERTELWPRERDRLVAVVRRGVRIAAAFGVLFVGGAAIGWRRLPRGPVAMLLGWFALAIPLFGAQLWFGYHLYLFLVPVTLLGWLGLDALVSSTDGPRPIRLGAVALAALLGLSQVGPDLADKLRLVADHRGGITQDDRDDLRVEADPAHAVSLAYADWIDREALGDEGWALGASLDVLYAAGQDHAVPIIGFAPLLLRPDDWAVIDADLEHDPPDTIALATATYADLDARSPSTRALIEGRYCLDERFDGVEFWRLGTGSC